MDNEKYMKRCYELAIQAGKKGFDTFGALIVHGGEITLPLRDCIPGC